MLFIKVVSLHLFLFGGPWGPAGGIAPSCFKRRLFKKRFRHATQCPAARRLATCGAALVEVIFSDGLGSKLRPALILSDNDYNKSRDEVIVVAITSNVKQIYKGDTEIANWEKAGLKVPSLATAILQTVKKNRIRKTLGQIVKSDFDKIEKNISGVMGFSI